MHYIKEQRPKAFHILGKFKILLTRTTTAQNVDKLRYHGMRGLYFLTVVFRLVAQMNILDFWYQIHFYLLFR